MMNPSRFTKSLAVRIVLPFAVILVVVTALLALYLGSTVRTAGLRELRERGELLADTLAYNAELPLLAGDSAALASLLEAAGRYPDLLIAEVIDKNGRSVVRFAPPGAGHSDGGNGLMITSTVYTQPIAEGQEGGALSLDAGPGAPRRPIGRVVLFVSPARTAARTRSLQFRIAAVGGGLFLLSIAIGAVFVKILGAPLRALVDATRRVAGGDLSVRVVPSSADEIGEVGKAFNRMAEDLGVARAEVLAERADLERRVALRTAELERAQETLIQSEKMSAVGQLVAGVAHELNNPLTVVLGYAGLILQQSPDPALRRKLELMAGEAERASKIVQNLLAFARKQKKERAPVNLNEVVTRTLNLRSYHLKSGNIGLESDLAAELPPTMADFHQLQQVILNLLVNAEQAMLESGKGSKIRVSTRREGETLELDVEDDGPGMPPSVRSRIFEPFFTTKPVGKGTGLGLSICYGIIGEHDGKIQVESEPDRFTRFRISLPVVAVPSTEEVVSPARTRWVEPPRQPRVLVIDDDPGILQFVEDAFTGEAVIVETALGGRDGVARLSTGRLYDVILCDMRMPDLDGRSIFRFIRENRPDLERRLVFATGDVANAEVVEFMEISGRPVLEKPFSVEALRDAVSRACERGG